MKKINTINQLEVKYLRSSRTMEKIELSNNYKKSVCFVYNYEGYHFRLFGSETELNLFFKKGNEPKLSFDSEEGLDKFLLYYESPF